MAEHPYFTRSKDSKDSFPNQSLSKGKEKMTERSEDIDLPKFSVMDPVIVEQNKLIAQLKQQIVEMRSEIQETRELVTLAIATGAPVFCDGKPPLYVPTPDLTSKQSPNNQSTTTILKPLTIDLAISNPHCASSSHQASLPPRNLNINDAHTFQDPPTQSIQDPPTTQLISSKAISHIPLLSKSHLPLTTYFQPNHYKEKEKEWMAKQEIIEATKEFYHTSDTVGSNCEDLCIHPNLDLPEGFEVPKFDIFSEDGDPRVHLKAYCDQFIGVEISEPLLMQLFSHSLSGEALDWFVSRETEQRPSWNALAKAFIERFAYNIELIPDRYALERIKQRSTEIYREYAYRWRKEAARVRPPMTEKEIVKLFMRIQEPEYFDRMSLIMGAKFDEIVKVGEAIEYGLENGKVTRNATQTKSSGLLRRKREDDSFEPKSKRHARLDSQKHSLSKTHPQAPRNSYHVFSAQTNYQAPLPNYQNIPPNYQAPLPNYQNIPPNYQAPLPNYQSIPPNYQAPMSNFQIPAPTYQITRNYRPVPLSSRSSAPCPNNVKKAPRVFTPLFESRTKLFERLEAAGLIQTIDPKNINVNSRLYKPELFCAYHSGGAGHATEDCINLKHKIQDLIDQRVITFQIVTPNVNSDPTLNNEGLTVNVIEGEEYRGLTMTMVKGRNLESIEVHDDIEMLDKRSKRLIGHSPCF